MSSTDKIIFSDNSEYLKSLDYYDKYTPIVASSDAIIKNLRHIDLTNPEGIENKKYAVYVPKEMGSNYELPVELSTTESVLYRDVKYRSSNHIMVTLYEAFPRVGRMWATFYNCGTWTGWSQTGIIPRKVTVRGEAQCTQGKILPYEAFCVFYDNEHTVDLHIHFSIEYWQEKTTSTTDFKIFNMDDLKSKLGVSSLSWDLSQSRVSVFGSIAYTGGYNGILGAYGLYFSPTGGLGRIYTNEIAAGGWPTSAGVYAEGNVYLIDIYRASFA